MAEIHNAKQAEKNFLDMVNWFNGKIDFLKSVSAYYGKQSNCVTGLSIKYWI